MSEQVIDPEPVPEPEPTPEPEPEPDESDGDEAEPVTEPETLPEALYKPPSDRVMEERIKASERAWKAYTSKIGAAFDEDALHLHECPLCPPVHKGFIDVRDAGLVPDEIKAVVMEYVGLARPADYAPDPETHECPTCHGFGLVTTGSRVVGNETRKCGRCSGYGFVPPPSSGSNGAQRHEDFLAPVGEHPEPHEGADVDPSGEPRLLPDGRENPNFGKWPQFKVPVAPWGATAGLSVQDAVA